MSNLLSLYELDKKKAKRFLIYACATIAKQKKADAKKLVQSEKINLLDTKVASLEKRNIELTNHILGLSRRLNEVQKLNDESKSLIIAQDEAERKIGSNVNELKTIIDTKKERIEALEKKIEDRLSKNHEEPLLKKENTVFGFEEDSFDKAKKRKELEEKIEEKLKIKKGKIEPVFESEETLNEISEGRKKRIKELNNKIKAKLEGKTIEPIKDKIAGLKDIYLKLQKTKGIKKTKLASIKKKIATLEKKLGKVKV